MPDRKVFHDSIIDSAQVSVDSSSWSGVEPYATIWNILSRLVRYLGNLFGLVLNPLKRSRSNVGILLADPFLLYT